MSPSYLSVWLLAGFCLVLTTPASVRAQDFYPPDRQPPERPVGFGGGAGSTPVEPARPAWYADAELAVLFTGAVHFNEHVAAVTGDHPVFLSPRVYLGRELENGGAVRFTYRNLTQVVFPGSAGRADSDWSSGESFTTNWLDLDYVSREYAPRDWWRVRWELGGRFVFRHEGWWGQDSYQRTESTQNFFAGGPHFGLTSNFLLGQSGWAIYSRADTAVTFGGGQSRYDSRPQQSDPWGMNVPRSERSSFGACQFDLGLQLGLMRRWQWRGRDIGLGAGVQADVLTLANLGGQVDAFGLVNVGPFARWEMRF